MKAVKFDKGKWRMSLIPQGALIDLAAVLEFGAQKYGEDNWRLGMDHRRPFNAAMRHLFAYMRGEVLDPESGLPHLAHALCNVVFLLEYSRGTHGKTEKTAGD